MNEPPKRLGQWLNDHAITIIALIFGAGAILQSVNTLSTRVDRLERRDEAKDAVMSDMRADLKLLLERTDPKTK